MSKQKPAFAGFCLYDARSFERCVRAVLIYGLDRAGREGDPDRFLELRDVDLFRLKVEIAAALSGRVKLRRAGRVRVSSAYYRGLLCDWAGFRHGSFVNV